MTDLKNIHLNILNLFLKYKQPKIYKIYNKRPFLSDGHFMFNRVIIISDNLVYKIHPVEYAEKQKDLVKLLHFFFETYSQPLDVTGHYKEDLCWTTWTRIPGELLGKGHLKNCVWKEYLNYLVYVWYEQIKKSKELNASEGQMWWHYDVTPWNVIVQPDGVLFLIDWDDIRLMDIKEAKQSSIRQNIEYAEMNDQDQNLIYKIFGVVNDS